MSRPAPVTLPLVVAGSYLTFQPAGVGATVVHDEVRKWAAAAEATLADHARIRMPVRAVDLRLSVWSYATQTTAARAADQALYFGTHPILWRLRAGAVLADLQAQVGREKRYTDRLHPNALDCLRWQGTLAGLPVALWPALLATDASLPAPPMRWTWEDAAAIPTGAGAWPMQLLPEAPPLESWLWPHGAALADVGQRQVQLDQPAAVTALADYGAAFGPAGVGRLSPPPGGDLRPEERAAFLSGPLLGEPSSIVQAWSGGAIAVRDQQVRSRLVGAWFPPGEWPPLEPAPHRWRDGVGSVRRLAPPGATRSGLPVIAYGVGIHRDAAYPDAAYQAALALQDTAPAFLPYAPATDDQRPSRLRERWDALDAAQASALAAILALPLRAAWSVPPPAAPGRPGWQAPFWREIGLAKFIVQPENDDIQYLLRDGVDAPDLLAALMQSLAQVLALGLLPVEQAAVNAVRQLRLIFAEWMASAAGDNGAHSSAAIPEVMK
jgi:hypothetical protein